MAIFKDKPTSPIDSKMISQSNFSPLYQVKRSRNQPTAKSVNLRTTGQIPIRVEDFNAKKDIEMVSIKDENQMKTINTAIERYNE
jgi:hypothetical protein